MASLAGRENACERPPHHARHSRSDISLGHHLRARAFGNDKRKDSGAAPESANTRTPANARSARARKKTPFAPRTKHMKKFFPSLLLLSAFLFVWEAASKLGNISKTILPAPSDIFAAIITYRDILVVHTIQTLEETLIGLLLATALGVGVAILLFLFPRARAAVYPLLVLSQTIPIIALAPLLLIWFGFDLLPKVIVVGLYCFFPIAIAVTAAV